MQLKIDNFLKSRNGFDIIFRLKDQVVVRGHSKILSALSSKFICNKRDTPLVFDMDARIKQSVLWTYLIFMYFGGTFEIDYENLDSFILLAYFFENQDFIISVDDFLFDTITKQSAVYIFNYAIDMDMSYNCKERIFTYIQRYVIKLPSYYTLDLVLMQPEVLPIVQRKNKVIGNYKTHLNIEEYVNAVNCLKVDGQLEEHLEEQLDVVENQPEEQVQEQVVKTKDVNENPEYDALMRQIEELIDIIEFYERVAATSSTNSSELVT